jgi:hypothetical protein
MEDNGISAEELRQALSGDFDRMVEEVVEAMNSAQPGRIIADSEEPVRDANAEFRQRLFEKALGLLQRKQEAFSPSGEGVEEQGQADDDSPDGERAC